MRVECNSDKFLKYDALIGRGLHLNQNIVARQGDGSYIVNVTFNINLKHARSSGPRAFVTQQKK